MVTVLNDEDVNRLVTMREAVDAVEAAIGRKGRGAFATPPRHYTALGNGAFVFTVGGDTEEGVAGFRVYGAGRLGNEAEQLVVVYDAASGALRGIVSGDRVGAMRTGAIGGVAIRYGAHEDASALALIGSGKQARTQLEAAAAVRNLERVRVYSRAAANREAFAAEMGAALGITIEPAASPEEAIDGADIVIVATSSPKPAFDAGLIEPGMHVTTIRLGADSHELDAAVADRAGAIFTDSIEQVQTYPGGFFLADKIDAVTDLSEHVASGGPARTSADEITLYCSSGMSGTEVVVADLALRKSGV